MAYEPGLYDQYLILESSVTYCGGEIDFVAQSISSQTRYLIEVKTGKGTASTAQKTLEQAKADKLLYLKGTTYGRLLLLPRC